MERDRLLDLSQNNEEAKFLYRNARNKVNHMIRSAKKDFYTQTLQENTHNPKMMWQALRSTMSTTAPVGPKLQKTNSSDKMNAKETADHFNKHFTSIGSKYRSSSDNDSFPSFEKLQDFIKQRKPMNDQFKIPNITSKFIMKQLHGMSNTKATGLDDIGIRLLKSSADIIAPQLTSICNLSIHTGIFPHSWKRARVVPIYKSGNTNDASNYRPISVLPVLSKVLERHVYDHYYSYLTKHKMLLDQQSGFRKHHSCQTVLTKLTDYFIENMDRGNLSGMVLIDLRKAFDLVDHDLLLAKVSMYGCTTMSHMWFTSYLRDRQQQVSYDGHLSQPLPVTLGVPQGSILGPLLFILFMNDVVLEVENSKFDMYADDSTLYSSAKSVANLNNTLTAETQPLYSWISNNRMVLNIEKTECMLLGTVQRLRTVVEDFSVGDGDFKITQVTSHKLLGVHIDQNLNWNIHLQKLCAKLRSRLYLFGRIKFLLPNDARRKYFSGLVQPLIDYGCIIWGNCSKDSLLQVHKIMKQYARSILDIKIPKEHPTITLFKKLDWLPIDVRVQYFEGIQMYNILKGTAPKYLLEMFDLVNNVHGHGTRHSQKLYVPKYKLVTGQRSFRYRGAVLWNSLDSDIKQSPSLDTFKCRFIKHLKKDLYNKDKFNLDQPKYYTDAT